MAAIRWTRCSSQCLSFQVISLSCPVQDTQAQVFCSKQETQTLGAFNLTSGNAAHPSKAVSFTIFATSYSCFTVKTYSMLFRSVASCKGQSDQKMLTEQIIVGQGILHTYLRKSTMWLTLVSRLMLFSTYLSSTCSMREPCSSPCWGTRVADEQVGRKTGFARQCTLQIPIVQ